MIILRLQGLNTEAEPEDIRRFFYGLEIPQGAVHIIGGYLGEAFILFKSERDGQLAMRRSGNALMGSRVTLHISSVAELKEKMSLCLQRNSTIDKHYPKTQQACSPKQQYEKMAALRKDVATSLPCPPVPLKQKESKRRSVVIEGDATSTSHPSLKITQIHQSPPALRPPLEKVSKKQLKSEAVACNAGYLCLYGLADTVTKAHIRHFLCGITVQEVLVNVCLGYRSACLVKVADEQEVEAGLQRNGHSFGALPVEVRKSTVEQWTHATSSRSRGSPKQFETVSSTSETHIEQEGRRISTCKKRPRSEDRLSETSKKMREEYYLMVRNLEPSVSKTKMKAFLGCPHLQNSKIQHLLDKNSGCTSTAFITFDRVEDYVNALNLSGNRFGRMVLEVSPITRDKMMSQLCSRK
ncbi:hypothetical protein ACEWY4_019436 [Coilia grayii]|uniref:RRM domain-containing protein n=1 Tax=Coilia grayii TaxID=363190 RepID=A0ABD1J9Q5_9TELE